MLLYDRNLQKYDPRTFTKNVTIRASVYDSQKRMVDTNTRSLFAHEYAPIKPGFEGTVKIPIECARGQAKSCFRKN